MKILTIILVITLIGIVSAGANCVQAFCNKEVAECKADETC